MYRLSFALHFLTVLVLSGHAAQARVFNYNDVDFTAFVRGTGGLSSLNQGAFGPGLGNGTSFTEESKLNYGAEAGVQMNLSSRLHLRFAAEVIQYAAARGEAYNSSGVERFKLESSVFVFNPNIGLEYVYSIKGNVRFFANVGAGYANVTVVNKFTMTETGVTELGVSSFDEKMEANTIASQLGFGLETLFTDNVTFVFDVGYRYLPVQELKYKGSDGTILQPSGVTSGAPVLNSDGLNRTLNLSGIYSGVSFRFNFL